MHDHNLDDLILDTKPRTTSRAKNILSLMALFIVVLIAGIVFSRIFFNNDTHRTDIAEENITNYVSSDLSLQNDPETVSIKDDKEDIIDIPEPSPENRAPVASAPKPIETEKKKTETKKEEVPAVSKPASPVASKKEPTPKKTAHAQKPAQRSNTHAKPTGSYYVQVGSFSKSPSSNSRMIRVIKTNGYRYKIYKTNGMYKVLIGPYPTRAKADKAIGDIRAKINKQAFVYTMK
jgi:cell division septation protein DedD